MLTNAFAPKASLLDSSRVPAISRATSISAAELGCLFLCGSVATLAVGILRQLQIPVPGHAILRATLPMALGFALVPRRSAGIVMSVSAGLAAAVLSWSGLAQIPTPAALSVVALGPVLDIAMSGRPQGWRLYVRFAMAGSVANLLAFALKLAAFKMGWDSDSGGNFASVKTAALISFFLCGAVAGLVSAAIWFRARVDNDLRRN